MFHSAWGDGTLTAGSEAGAEAGDGGADRAPAAVTHTRGAWHGRRWLRACRFLPPLGVSGAERAAAQVAAEALAIGRAWGGRPWDRGWGSLAVSSKQGCPACCMLAMGN